jgi:diphosphomevalonate decarboxylase
MTDEAYARASANIALAKYWGKSDIPRNLTAVPSLSLTLAGLDTVTHVVFDAQLTAHDVRLDGRPATDGEKRRVVALLDTLRAQAGRSEFARVDSRNHFPTASGLASSASGFAALALAASAAAGLSSSLESISALARAASASAARSLFGGWVMLEAGAECAERVADASHLDVKMIVAVTDPGPKGTGSSEGMQHTAHTSPYYATWLAHSRVLFEEIRTALSRRDLSGLGTAAEQSALMMHACMLSARPALLYFRPATLAVLEKVRALRAAGSALYATMDAGPHVKVLCAAADADPLAAELGGVPGVTRIIVASPGSDATLLDASEGRRLLRGPNR